MSKDPLTTVTLRNDFYRDSYRRILLVLFFSLVANLGLSCIVTYMILNPPTPKYFATTIDGEIQPLFPLNEPNQSDEAVLQWANEATVAAFTYNFVNYRDELQAASGFFTPNGWRQFLDALKSSNNLDAVTTKKLVVSAVATKAPVILEKGPLFAGRYSWRIQMPLLVTYQSASQFTEQNAVVTMLVTRVSTLNSPRGIGIEQFVVGTTNSL